VGSVAAASPGAACSARAAQLLPASTALAAASPVRGAPAAVAGWPAGAGAARLASCTEGLSSRSLRHRPSQSMGHGGACYGARALGGGGENMRA